MGCNMKRHYGRVHLKLKNSPSDNAYVPCPECGRIFRRRCNMKKHFSVVHLKLKPFACTYCEWKFSQNPSLTTHISTVHQGIKRFRCDICLYPSAHKHGLLKHTRKHAHVERRKQQAIEKQEN